MQAMTVNWETKKLNGGPGHGVCFELTLEGMRFKTLTFIDGQSWLKDKEPEVDIYLDTELNDYPSSITTELRLAILLFLTDKRRQTPDSKIHGFQVHYNA